MPFNPLNLRVVKEQAKARHRMMSTLWSDLLIIVGIFILLIVGIFVCAVFF